MTRVCSHMNHTLWFKKEPLTIKNLYCDNALEITGKHTKKLKSYYSAVTVVNDTHCSLFYEGKYFCVCAHARAWVCVYVTKD